MYKINGELLPAGGGDNIPLIREKLTLGRRETCDVCLRFPNISGVHAELSYREGFWYIRDLNSTNGVKVNGVRVLEKLLNPKDRLTIGKRDYVINYEVPKNSTARMEDEDEIDIRSASLLERAGLAKPKDLERYND